MRRFDPCAWPGEIMVGADILVLKPMVCTYDYGTRDDQALSMKPDIDWGARPFVGYQRDCSFAQISYLYVDGHDALAVGDATTLQGLGNGPFEEVIPRLRLSYQNLDIRLGQYLKGGRFAAYANGRWVSLTHGRSVHALEGGNPVHLIRDTEFCGGGLGVGVKGRFHLWRCLDAFGDFNLLGVIGNRRSTKDETLFSNGQILRCRFGSNVCVIPALDLRLGISYPCRCGRLTTMWRLGYELNTYWKALEIVDQELQQTCKDIGFSGLFLGGKVLF